MINDYIDCRQNVGIDHVPDLDLRVGDHGAVPARVPAPAHQQHHPGDRGGPLQDRDPVHQVGPSEVVGRQDLSWLRV